jgi:redox-sensitive bicupin YhaK (pirin superfamily)
MAQERSVNGVVQGTGVHWVGDGFRVTNLFPSSNDLGERLSPFFLMDYHPPFDYGPTQHPRGVGAHPHRGIETITLAFEGAVAHHDSTGGGGIIGPGDVQWMTAAGGILHKEYHEASWAARGGTMHMMQLWVNLPAAHKMDPPRYQPLVAGEMGQVVLPDDSGLVRVIAGEYQGTKGPAKTFSPINLWDLRLSAGGRMDMSFPASQNAGLFVLDGTIVANGTKAEAEELIVFDNVGEKIDVESERGAHLLVLNGEPIDEPIVAYGPFVMNTEEQILEAYQDFEAGKFGYLD